MKKDCLAKLRSVILLLLLFIYSTGWAQTQTPSTLILGTPPWPGLKVKTEVTEQILQSLGYRTKTKNLGVPFIVNDLKTGQLDVYMGAWMPVEKDMFASLIKNKKVLSLGNNLINAGGGLAVPAFVWKSGIHSVKDLAEHASKFNHKVYGIGAGSGFNKRMHRVIKNNYEGLGDFKVVATSTAVMLAQVKRSIAHHKPIVFDGWKPHWMNIKFDLRYLKDKGGTMGLGYHRITVLTMVRSKLPKDHPNVASLLRQIKVRSKTQSRWIYDFSYKHENLHKVAHRWLASHPETVEPWLRSVQTINGKPAITAYRKAFIK